MRGRVRVAVRRRPEPAPWWIWALLAVGLVGLVPHGHAQSAAPTLPPGSGGDRSLEVRPPATESPLVPPEGGIRKPVPDPGIGRDGGVVPGQPLDQTGVIRPPVTGAMPAIPSPGSAGGDVKVIPK